MKKVIEKKDFSASYKNNANNRINIDRKYAVSLRCTMYLRQVMQALGFQEAKLSSSQPWLKSMENGGLGEARAKSFLLERFWVLERSVDIQGADYLIQRRLTSQNFMDKEPPKLGVVQVKFIQDGMTQITINKNYVCNDSGRAYGEFFLLVFSGQEDEARSFLLSSNDIIENFREKEDKGKIHLKIKGEKILNSSNFEILNKSTALGKIEHALVQSSFSSNRMFLGATNYIKLSPEQIEHDFLLPLDNGYADLQEEFFKNKKRLQSTLFDIEEVIEGMNNILKTTDPEVAFEIYEDVISQYVGSSMGTYISFGIDFFDDEDFLEAVKNHKERLSAVRGLGLESSFFALLKFFEHSVAKQASELLLDENDKIKVMVKYNSSTLEQSSVIVTKHEYTGECPNVSVSKLGHQEIYYSPWDWLSWEVRAGKEVAPKESIELEKQYINSRWQFRRTFQVALEKILIGEELIAPWMET